MIFPILFGIVAVLFLLLKLPISAVALSDTNVYISMAQHILAGKLLYKDMFLTNLPFFPYLSVFYLWLSKSNITFFYSTATFEALLGGIVLYFAAQKKGRPRSIPVMVASSYLFSMIVLATSDHQTGIFFASLMAVLSYFFYTRERFVLAGITIGFMFVTKGYMLPVLLAFGGYDIYTRQKQAWRLLVPAAVVILLVLLPTLLFAQADILRDIFGYTLSRPSGLNKWNVFQFFVVNQWLYVGAMVFSFFNYRKNTLVAITLLGGLVFLFLFQDIYFFYLNILVPFMALALGDGIEFLARKFGRLNGLMIATLVVSFSMLLNYKMYTENLALLQKVRNINSFVDVIKKEKPQRIFGAVEIAPVLSYLSGTPLLFDIIDTNENLFVRKVYDLAKIKKGIYSERTMVVTLGADRDVTLPNGNSGHLVEPVLPQMFKELDIKKNCSLAYSQPVFAEGITNRINLWKCYK